MGGGGTVGGLIGAMTMGGGGGEIVVFGGMHVVVVVGVMMMIVAVNTGIARYSSSSSSSTTNTRTGRQTTCTEGTSFQQGLPFVGATIVTLETDGGVEGAGPVVGRGGHYFIVFMNKITAFDWRVIEFRLWMGLAWQLNP